MPKLTLKQENFVNSYFETGNASKAYRVAYNVDKMKSESIGRKAFELLQNVNITATIEEMRLKAQNNIILSVTQRKEALTKIILNGEPNEAIRAIDVLNKMDGVYTQKVEHSGNGFIQVAKIEIVAG